MYYTILIVEDNCDHLELIKIALKRTSIPITIESTGSGAETIKKCRENHYDLIILDHNLPDCSGLEVLTLMQKKKINIPVLVVSGYGSEKIAVDYMKKGVIDYLVKDTDYLKNLPGVVNHFLKEKKHKRLAM